MNQHNIQERVEQLVNSRQSEVIERLLDFLIDSSVKEVERVFIFYSPTDHYVALKLAAHRLRRRIENDFYDADDAPAAWERLNELNKIIAKHKENRKQQKLLDQGQNPYTIASI